MWLWFAECKHYMPCSTLPNRLSFKTHACDDSGGKDVIFLYRSLLKSISHCVLCTLLLPFMNSVPPLQVRRVHYSMCFQSSRHFTGGFENKNERQRHIIEDYTNLGR